MSCDSTRGQIDLDGGQGHGRAVQCHQRILMELPEFGRQWHLVNGDYPEHMMNVTALWEEGITGEGIITAFVDDGLDYTSDDLAANFVSGPGFTVCVEGSPCSI